VTKPYSPELFFDLPSILDACDLELLFWSEGSLCVAGVPPLLVALSAATDLGRLVVHAPL